MLQVIPGLEVTPGARAAIEIAAALGAAGARALVACAGGRLKGELQAKGGVFVPFHSRTKNPLAMALNVRRLALHVRSRALAWVAYGATRLTKTPFVTTFPSVDQGSNPIALRYNSVLARGDAVLADSNFTAALIAKLHFPAAGKIRVVHYDSIAKFSPRTPSRPPAFRPRGGIGRLRRMSELCFWRHRPAPAAATKF